MNSKIKVSRSREIQDSRKVELEVAPRGGFDDVESARPETKKILQLAAGKGVGLKRLSDIETAVKMLAVQSIVPATKCDPFEVVSFDDIVKDFGGTARSVEYQIASVLGKSFSIKIGKTKGIRKENLLRFYELQESKN